jgi:hypothetical protein
MVPLDTDVLFILGVNEYMDTIVRFERASHTARHGALDGWWVSRISFVPPFFYLPK